VTRDEQEMALWRRVAVDEGFGFADEAVEQFRKRYPPQTSAPPAVWYDEPPRAGEYHVEGLSCVCWVDEDVVWCPRWDCDDERPLIREMPRAGRRVCPITKPQEPPQ